MQSQPFNGFSQQGSTNLESIHQELRWEEVLRMFIFSILFANASLLISFSGANLSVVLTLKAALLEPPIPLIFQLLTVPVIDNTATAETAWYANRNAPWLTPTRMTWYRNMYLPNEADSKTWAASPNLAPLELISKSPPSWIGVSEQDMLATEGISYGEQLKKAGVSVKVNVYAGSTDSILSLDGMCSVSPPQSA
jgi:acetyl esterase/lipase